MFGFIATPCAACTSESFPAWRGAFCGLARCLGREFGNPARLLVNRDATFVGLLGLSLDPAAPRWKHATCCNPLARPYPVADDHPAILHAAAVSVCGLATKLADDSRDEGTLRRGIAKLGTVLTSPAADRAVAILNSGGFPTARVTELLGSQESVESTAPLRADEPTATAYGIITAHLATLLDVPQHRKPLSDIGAALGSLVYWRDAWDDRAEDRAQGRFNPFEQVDSTAIHRRITAAWDGFTSSLSQLPLLRNAGLVANLQTTTAQRQRPFLHLQATKEKKKRRRKEGAPWWHHCDCCPCHGSSHGSCCCDAACDWGPGDHGCCDCCPCDGIDCCPCN